MNVKRNRTMEQLATSFPSLRGKSGTKPWDALELEQWALSPAPSHGALCAARFVLAVWAPSTRWKCGAFDLMDALSTWDGPHRAAFVAWVTKPWWP